MYKGTVYVVFDGQAGSCGKGKFTGYFALIKRIDVSINNNTPNAGHTFVFDNGRKIVTTHLPIAVVNPNISLFIGAAAAIYPPTLLAEIERYSDLLGDRVIYIHQNAAIVTDDDIEWEKQHIRSGSTFKGTSRAISKKITRDSEALLAKNINWHSDKIRIYNDNYFVDNILAENLNILVETSQGFDLGINHGLEYPYCTSRECTVSQALADCGIPHNANVISYMVFRPYPIRISNQSIMGEIYTGGYDEDIDELTWGDIEQMSGCPNLTEYTTVTKKVRRVFPFSYNRFYNAIMLNNPTYLILNFAQHLDGRIINMNSLSKLRNIYNKPSTAGLEGLNPVLDFKEDIESIYGKPIAYIGTGPKISDQINLGIDGNVRLFQTFTNEHEDITLKDTGTCYTYNRRHF